MREMGLVNVIASEHQIRRHNIECHAYTIVQTEGLTTTLP